MNDEEAKVKSTQPTTVQVVVFELDNEEYAVPIEDVREVIKIPEITPVPNSPDFISGLINLRGKILPAINLEVRFSLMREHKDIQAKNIIIVEGGESSFGVIVDTIVEVLRVPSNSIQDAPSAVRTKIGSQYIKGVIVIGGAEEPSFAGAAEDKQENQQDQTKETLMSTTSEHEQIVLLLNLKQLLTEGEKREVKSVAGVNEYG